MPTPDRGSNRRDTLGWSEDVTITTGLGLVRVAAVGAVLVIVCAVAAARADSGNWADTAVVALLLAPLWAGVLPWCLVQLRSGRPGTVVCTLEGLSYIRWLRPEVLPWAAITDVHIDRREPVDEETIFPRYRTLVRCGANRIPISNRSTPWRRSVERQVATITEWHDRFATPALHADVPTRKAPFPDPPARAGRASTILSPIRWRPPSAR